MRPVAASLGRRGAVRIVQERWCALTCGGRERELFFCMCASLFRGTFCVMNRSVAMRILGANVPTAMG